jgi:two-component system chemotaxis response regulator CheB
MVTQMLSRSPFVEVVATAHDGARRSSWPSELKPDVITCDLTMPEMGASVRADADVALAPFRS